MTFTDSGHNNQVHAQIVDQDTETTSIIPRSNSLDFASDCRVTWNGLQIDETCNQLLDLRAPTDRSGKGTRLKGGEARHLLVGFGGISDVVRSI